MASILVLEAVELARAELVARRAHGIAHCATGWGTCARRGLREHDGGPCAEVDLRIVAASSRYAHGDALPLPREILGAESRAATVAVIDGVHGAAPANHPSV